MLTETDVRRIVCEELQRAKPQIREVAQRELQHGKEQNRFRN